MDFEAIQYEREDGIVIVTLSNPARLNAISVKMSSEIDEVISEIETDQTVRALIFTGGPDAKGRPCFSAGADLTDAAAMAARPAYRLEIQDTTSRLADLPIATIAAVDGICTAGGLEVALAFDIRVVGESLRFGDTHLKTVGFGLGGAGASTRFPRLIGASNAKYFAFTGDLLGHDEALRMGFANRSFPSEQLLDGAKEIARKAAAMSPEGLKITKAHINIGMQMSVNEALRFADQIVPLAAPQTYATSRRMADEFAKGSRDNA